MIPGTAPRSTASVRGNAVHISDAMRMVMNGLPQMQYPVSVSGGNPVRPGYHAQSSGNKPGTGLTSTPNYQHPADDSLLKPDRQKQWGWTTLDGVIVPFVMRGNEKFVSVKMVELKLLSKFPKICMDDMANAGPIYSYYVTDSEAKQLTEINTRCYNHGFGTKSFTTKDLIVSLDNFLTFYNRAKAHFESKDDAPKSPIVGGWVQINNTIVPYLIRAGVKYVPLSVIKYAAGLLVDVRMDGYKVPVTEQEYNFLNLSCKSARINFTFSIKSKLIKLERVIRMSHTKVNIIELPNQDPFSHAQYQFDKHSVENPTAKNVHGYQLPIMQPPVVRPQAISPPQMNQMQKILPPKNPFPSYHVSGHSMQGYMQQTPPPPPYVQRPQAPFIRQQSPSPVGQQMIKIPSPSMSPRMQMNTMSFRQNRASASCGSAPNSAPNSRPSSAQSGSSNTPPNLQPSPLLSDSLSNPAECFTVFSFEGNRLSCLLRGETKEPWALLEAVVQLYFPQFSVVEFQNILQRNLCVTIDYVTPEEEKLLLRFYELNTTTLRSKSIISFAKFKECYSKLMSMFISKAALEARIASSRMSSIDQLSYDTFDNNNSQATVKESTTGMTRKRGSTSIGLSKKPKQFCKRLEDTLAKLRQKHDFIDLSQTSNNNENEDLSDSEAQEEKIDESTDVKEYQNESIDAIPDNNENVEQLEDEINKKPPSGAIEIAKSVPDQKTLLVENENDVTVTNVKNIDVNQDTLSNNEEMTIAQVTDECSVQNNDSQGAYRHGFLTLSAQNKSLDEERECDETTECTSKPNMISDGTFHDSGNKCDEDCLNTTTINTTSNDETALAANEPDENTLQTDMTDNIQDKSQSPTNVPPHLQLGPTTVAMEVHASSVRTESKQETSGIVVPKQQADLPTLEIPPNTVDKVVATFVNNNTSDCESEGDLCIDETVHETSKMESIEMTESSTTANLAIEDENQTCANDMLCQNEQLDFNPMISNSPGPIPEEVEFSNEHLSDVSGDSVVDLNQNLNEIEVENGESNQMNKNQTHIGVASDHIDSNEGEIEKSGTDEKDSTENSNVLKDESNVLKEQSLACIDGDNNDINSTDASTRPEPIVKITQNEVKVPERLSQVAQHEGDALSQGYVIIHKDDFIPGETFVDSAIGKTDEGCAISMNATAHRDDDALPKAQSKMKVDLVTTKENGAKKTTTQQMDLENVKDVSTNTKCDHTGPINHVDQPSSEKQETKMDCDVNLSTANNLEGTYTNVTSDGMGDITSTSQTAVVSATNVEQQVNIPLQTSANDGAITEESNPVTLTTDITMEDNLNKTDIVNKNDSILTPVSTFIATTEQLSLE